ncbi:MAG: tetratricopeptide repeat protein [Candidatus Nitrotoga sp.]
MATLDMQGQEQVDAFKSWWKVNGKYAIATLVVVVLSAGAAMGWQVYQAKQISEASTLYAELEKQLSSNDPKRINDAATVIFEKYSSTPYAPRAALLSSQVNIFVGDVVQAKTQLRWVLNHAKEAGLQDIALLQLASILLDEKDYAGSLKLLEETYTDAFVGLHADLKGDVLSSQGKIEEARAAYQQALDKTDATSSYRTLIQMKLDGLAK